MKEELSKWIAKSVKDITEEEIMNLLEIPPEVQMGDFSLPCFLLAKKIHKSPMIIAKEIKEALERGYGKEEYIVKMQTVQGYLNFYLKPEYYIRKIMLEAIQFEYGESNCGQGKTICMDYSSPNIAKNFHVGHLRTTIIGNSLYKIFTKLGYQVIRINHLGDWGTQFGKLIVAYKKWSSRERVEENGIDELLRIYVLFHEKAETDSNLIEEARHWFAKMEHGDEEALDIWKWFYEISMKEFERMYELLDITFDYYTGESFYRDLVLEVVRELKEKNLLLESQGANIVDLEPFQMPPCLITKKDGSSIYPSRDLATIFYRKKQFHFDKCLYVTGNEQKLHFAQVFKVVELMGYDWYDSLIHIPYGLVRLAGGKLSSRDGNIVYAEDILKEAIARALALTELKSSKDANKESENEVEGREDSEAESKAESKAENREGNKEKDIESVDKLSKNKANQGELNFKNKTQHHDVAKEVGVGAIIFHDLYNQRMKDIDFIWEQVLNFDGATGPYVQYTYARAKSILRKSNIQTKKLSWKEAYLKDEVSYSIIKIIGQYPSVIKEAAKRYEPCLIARYAISLAQAFNKFYHECNILYGEEELKQSRLMLVFVVQKTMKDAMGLLGIQCPEVM